MPTQNYIQIHTKKNTHDERIKNNLRKCFNESSR